MEKKQYNVIETMHGTFQTTLSKKHLARKPWQPVNPKHLKSAIPGTVVEVLVQEGQEVKVGDILIVYKAMKMNNNVRATLSGKIGKIHVQAGSNLPSQTLMIEME